MSMDESSVVDDSYDDEESIEIFEDSEEESRQSKLVPNFIRESDDDGASTSGSSLNPSAASSISGEYANDRLTPIIRKAIRRSIHRIVESTSDEDSNDGEEEPEADIAESSGSVQQNASMKNYQIESEEESEDEYVSSREQSMHSNRKAMSPENPQIKKPLRHIEYVQESGDSDDESYEKVNSSSDQSNISIKGKIHTSREQQLPASVDSEEDIEVLDVPKKQADVVDILNSSDEKENEPDNSLENSFAMSMAKEETQNTTIDPLMAQERALLIYKQQKLQTKLAKSRMLLKTGNMASLPDKGDRVRESIRNDENELEILVEQLKMHSRQFTFITPKVEVAKQAPLFKQDNLEIDPTYLKPTTEDDAKKLGKKALETLEREQSLTVERLKDLHGSLIARPTEDERAEDPRGLKVPLMPHQQHALAWLLWREQQKPRGGVLADDMGLGKTLTMIALIMLSLFKSQADEESDDENEWQSSGRPQKHLGGTLVVAPASLLAQWESEVKNRVKHGLLIVELFHGNNRENVAKRLAKTDIVLTTYNILSREFKTNGVLYKIRWRRVILDEAHVIRNHKSQTCEAACGLHANKRWALTGTPVHNKEMDLYAILKFLQCSPFDDLRVWKRWVDNKNDAGQERLATVMKSLMLRRTKAELQARGALESLPEKNIEVIDVTLDPEERLVYDKVMVYSRTLFAQFLAQRAEKRHMLELGAGIYDKPSWKTTSKDTQFTKAQKKLLSLHADVKSHEILVLLLRLRQVCCHPALINSMLDQEDIEATPVEDGGTDIDLLSKMGNMNLNGEGEDNDNDGDFGVDERVKEHLLTSDNPVFDPKRQSSKMRAVFAKVEEILDKGEKLIIVSQWVGVLQVIADELESVEGANYRFFTGQVAVKDRQGIMDEFNSRSAKTNILLLSLTAGGVGLNLVGANHLLLIDIHWNPQLESQAQDRIYRFGQKKNVFIYKYICADTIEERIKELQKHKMELANAVLSGGGKVVGSKLSLDDIKSLFSM